MVHRRDGAAVAKMARDEPQILERTAQKVCRLLRGVAMARTMSAVAANPIVLVVAVRQRVHVRLGRHRRMERRVEDGDLRRVGHQSAHGVDASVRMGVVERRQYLDVGELLARVVVDERCAREVLPTRDQAIAHGVDLVEPADGRIGIVGQVLEQLGQALVDRQAGHPDGALREIGGKRDAHRGRIGAHALGLAPHERDLAVGFDKLTLERRAASIHHEHLHAASLVVNAHCWLVL